MAGLSSTEHTELVARLDEIGTLRREFKRLRARAAELAEQTIPGAVEAGMSITEISARTDLARTAIYTLLERRSHE